MSIARAFVALGVLTLLGLGILLDARASERLNPYRSPPLLALGSGQEASGAHCAAVPDAD